jgi:hypothetical protein
MGGAMQCVRMLVRLDKTATRRRRRSNKCIRIRIRIHLSVSAGLFIFQRGRMCGVAAAIANQRFRY